MKPILSHRQWAHYEFSPSFVLGFHGCDASVGESILRGDISHLQHSYNDYDWLGSGIYFWEGNPARALQFAKERAEGGKNSQGKIDIPFVLGAIINLKRCLNLADSSAIEQVEYSYRHLEEFSFTLPIEMPVNGKNLKARQLDCLVFNTLHQIREEEHHEPYDSVRGLFWEGKPIYPGAGVGEAARIIGQ